MGTLTFSSLVLFSLSFDRAVKEKTNEMIQSTLINKYFVLSRMDSKLTNDDYDNKGDENYRQDITYIWELLSL